MKFLPLCIILMVLAVACTPAAKPAPLQQQLSVTDNQGTSISPYVSHVRQADDSARKRADAGMQADLKVLNVWVEGTTIYCTVKNIGDLESKPTTGYLYVNRQMPPCGGTSFIDSLGAGEERTLSFAGYSYSFGPWGGVNAGGGGVFANPTIWERYTLPTGKVEYVALGPISNMVKVCIGINGNASDSKENKNCIASLWGELLDYDLLPLSHLASFTNGKNMIAPLGPDRNPNGSVSKMSDGSLQMLPEQTTQGYVQGYWGFYYTGNSVGESAPMKIPAKAHLITRVGLPDTARGGDGTYFKVGLRTAGDNVKLIASKKMTIPGVFEDWDVDLADYEGEIVYYILRAESGIVPSNDFAIWKEARLKQVN